MKTAASEMNRKTLQITQRNWSVMVLIVSPLEAALVSCNDDGGPFSAAHATDAKTMGVDFCWNYRLSVPINRQRTRVLRALEQTLDSKPHNALQLYDAELHHKPSSATSRSKRCLRIRLKVEALEGTDEEVRDGQDRRDKAKARFLCKASTFDMCLYVYVLIYLF